MRYAIFLAVFLILPLPARADFAPVTERDRFVALVSERDLTRFGIRLKVTPDGQIRGRAFGRDVTGAWRWNGAYFCRDLYWGNMDLGPDCQAVRINGTTLRFIADQGHGQFADLTLR
ncbi:MAG: dihydrodipicolinate reductase [Roseovarius sp.]|nr:dihydrodipicolinate reductase [Roseovarius sp.]